MSDSLDLRHALQMLAIPAVRYALGRMTYVVGDVTGTLMVHRDRLSATTREVIVRDITEAETLGGLGHEMDAERWRDLRDALR